MLYVGDTKYKMYVGNASMKFHIDEPDCFYIYHTSNNIIEKRYIKDYPTIDFPSIAGNNYGGVYTDYGGKGNIAVALENGQYSSEGVTNIVDDGTPYNGELTSGTKLFDSVNNITENTTAYTPQAGTIYYLKENPGWILQQYTQYYPTGRTAKMTHLFAITGVDSLNYNSVTLYLKEESDTEYEAINMSVVPSMTIASITLNCSTVFKTKGCPTNTGWLCYYNIFSKVEAGKTYYIYFEFNTPDGIVLHSPYIRKLTVQEVGRNMTHEDIPFE